MAMIRDEIVLLLEQAVSEAQERELIPRVSLVDVTVERPQNAEHGDYATSLPLKLARAARMDPMVIANHLADLFSSAPFIEKVEVAAPGFINLTLKGSWLSQQVEAILEAAETYGNRDLGQGQKVQVEFVSGNPTGPLHVGHGRHAVLGSVLANVLAAAGYAVDKEYYLNDAGSQIDAFYRSLYVRYQQHWGLSVAMPPDGYMGEYMVELAQEIAAEEGDRFLAFPEPEGLRELGKLGMTKIIQAIRADLELMRVEFDNWFSEASLYEGGQYKEALVRLEREGYIKEKEGAVWFVSSALGDDKDNVVVRSSGVPTYFASDIAYHYNKFLERGYDRVIDIWGADHQGHVSRMKAVAAALGINPERLQVIIAQMVTLRRGAEILRLSKRTGDIITLREVVEEVGPDACRFFFLSRSADSQMDFDLELAKRQSAENPVYYVQYAHARIASILRLAAQRKVDYRQGDVSLLALEPELTLIRYMLMLPELVETIARQLEPHHLPHYALELATVFHSFYKQCRVVSADKALTAARLKLVAAAQLVLAKTLHLMGMTAPERM